MGANHFATQRAGFTLIEMIAGIVIMAIAMTALTAVLFPHAKRSIDSVYQVRAAELGQSLINEVMGKAFDENTDLNSGIRCGENVIDNDNACTSVNMLGPDGGEGVDDYDDVDDYHGYNQDAAQLDSNSTYGTLYPSFTFMVEVKYDDDVDGTEQSDRKLFKQVTVTVTTPGGEDFAFVQYKGNY